MALKTTQQELKKRYKEEIAELKDAIKLKCWDCTGFQADGYEDCEIYDCSLYPYRLNRSISRCSAELLRKVKEIKAKTQRLSED